MSKLGPIHYKDFEKVLRYLGCQFKRQKGDHRVWVRDDLKRPVIIPAEKDIPVFVIITNLRTLNISHNKYLEILGEVS